MADNGAAFTVILGLLAIECIGDIYPMLFKKCGAGDGRQRNTLVGGSEQNIEADPGIDGASLARLGPSLNSPALKK